jgi:hypothetical protein
MDVRDFPTPPLLPLTIMMGSFMHPSWGVKLLSNRGVDRTGGTCIYACVPLIISTQQHTIPAAPPAEKPGLRFQAVAER